MKYFHDYWKSRGMGYIPPPLGIDQPVQTYEHPLQTAPIYGIHPEL